MRCRAEPYRPRGGVHRAGGVGPAGLRSGISTGVDIETTEPAAASARRARRGWLALALVAALVAGGLAYGAHRRQAGMADERICSLTGAARALLVERRPVHRRHRLPPLGEPLAVARLQSLAQQVGEHARSARQPTLRLFGLAFAAAAPQHGSRKAFAREPMLDDLNAACTRVFSW